MSALVLTIVLAISGDPLAGYEMFATSTGPLWSRGWGQTERESVARWSQEALSLARERLECDPSSEFQIVLCPDFGEFRRVVRALSTMEPESDQILGVAIPRTRTLVIRGGLSPRFGNVRSTVVHEVVHLVLHEQAAVLPRWVDEGIATWLSGRGLTLEEQGYLALLARTGGLYELKQLETRFPGGHLPTAAAYQQSLHFVTYLADVYGPDTPARLVARLRAQPSVSTAPLLAATCGQAAGDVEADFRRWVRARVSFATMLAALVQPWTIASFLAVLAIARYWWRRRQRLAQWERDEPREPPHEPPAEGAVGAEREEDLP